jgi:diguanylate cyclase (GGDEF)-like protein
MQVAIFIYYIVKGATKNLHKIKKAFKFIVLINFLFLLLTPVFKYAFYITQNNQFVTGNLYFVMVLLMMLPLLLVLFTLLYNYTSTSFLNSRVVALILFLTLSIIMTTAYLQLEYTFEMSAILPVITVTLFILHLMLVSKVITQDHLTKVQNKLGLEAYMSQLYKTINYYTAVIFFDLDEFKELNDKYGHKKGDEALSEFAKILYNETKNKDTVARIGGDEFLVILLADKMEQIDVYIKSVKEHINKYNKQKDNVKLKYSYGVSIKKPGEALKKEDLISQADKEMYKNKHS